MTQPRHFSMIRELPPRGLPDAGQRGLRRRGRVLRHGVRCSRGRSPISTGRPRWSPAAFVFDVFDGRVARWRHTHSALGRELDSLADVISFGVAPAALGFAAGLRGGWDWVALIYFVCCGVSRLARYNVTAESAVRTTAARSTYFEGTPIPTSVVLVGVLAFAAWQGRIGDAIYGGAWTLGPWSCTRWRCCTCCPAR